MEILKQIKFENKLVCVSCHFGQVTLDHFEMHMYNSD